MKDTAKGKAQDEDIETALLDAELFIKYQAPERAEQRLRAALNRSPRSVQLRERLREITASRNPEEAARQCLALASLYIERDDLETAHDRLVEAKDLDPRISIAPGLEAIRRARRPGIQQEEQQQTAAASRAAPGKIKVTFAGDLSVISIFDAVQVIENSKLTGALSVTGEATSAGRVLFNEGRIVGAEAGESKGEDAFRAIVEISGGAFDFEQSAASFPVTIKAASNTNLILDSLRQLDEEKM